MAKIKIDLPDEVLSLLDAFVREVNGGATAADLIAVIVLWSPELKVLRRAEQNEHRLIAGLIGGGYI